MNLPVASSSGASKEQLQKALSFEAETLSGINAFDSLVGAQPLGMKGIENQFWVIQLPTTQRDAVEKVVKAFGSRLGGICHPGGLPKTFADADVGRNRWQRIEAWANGIFCIHKDTEKDVIAMEVINIDLRDNRWQGYAAEWQRGLERTDYTEVLLTGDTVIGSEIRSSHELCLDNDQFFKNWLQIKWLETRTL